MVRGKAQGVPSKQRRLRAGFLATGPDHTGNVAPLKTKKNVDNLLSCRYELKYRISESKAAAIEQYIRAYLPRDHYTKIRPEGAYPIVSLYLDSTDLKLCKETLRGKKNRFKLRIRSYSDEPATPCFFEIKRRVNDIIIKSRTRIISDDLGSLLPNLHRSLHKYKTDEDTLRQFQFYMQSINAGPVIRVRYMRRAYEGDSENRVRVTFDRQLCSNLGYVPNVSLNGGGWQRLETGNVILEIKFTSRYPAWLSRMVKTFNLHRQSMSKYAASIKNSYLLGYNAPTISGRGNG